MRRLSTVACWLLIASNTFAREIPAEWPEWLREAMMRESNTQATKQFSLADNTISGVVRGKFTEKPSLNGDYWYFATNIRADSEFMCWVFPESVDSASTTAAIADNLIELSAGDNGGIHSKSIYHQEVSSHEGTPILALEWLFVSGTEDNRQIGLIKVRTALVGDSSVVCGHTSVGYRETFKQAFEHLVANIVVPREQRPYYETLHKLSLDDTPIGFVRTWMTEDADGDTEIQTTDAMLMPVDNSNVSAMDGWSVEYSLPNGELINQYAFSSENGSLVMDLQINYQEESWVVSGTLQGKELLAPIDSDFALASTLGQFQRAREMMKADESGPVEMFMWLPDADPTALSTVEIAITENRKGKLKVGPLMFDAEFDVHGGIERSTANVGGLSMSLRKVWQQGSL